MTDNNDLPEKQNGNGNSGGDENIMLVLAYLGPLGLIPYLTDQSDTIKWHAKQGLTLTGVWLLIVACLSIPIFGWIFVLLMPFLSLAVLAIVIVAIIKAIGGERWRMPLIADLADKW